MTIAPYADEDFENLTKKVYRDLAAMNEDDAVPIIRVRQGQKHVPSIYALEIWGGAPPSKIAELVEATPGRANNLRKDDSRSAASIKLSDDLKDWVLLRGGSLVGFVKAEDLTGRDDVTGMERLLKSGDLSPEECEVVEALIEGVPTPNILGNVGS